MFGRCSVRYTLAAIALAAVGAAASAQVVDAGGGGGCRGVEVTESSGTRVAMRDNCFTSTILRVAPGELVEWVNEDHAAHTVTGANVGWGDFEQIAPGESVTHVFADPGTYPYYCLIHPGMIGAVVVVEPGTDGSAAMAGPGSTDGDAVDVAGPPRLAWGVSGLIAGMAVTGAGSLWVRRRR